MSYVDVFAKSDIYVNSLDLAAAQATDPLTKNRYAGFLAVTAVTFFEEAFKEIVCEFAKRKHPIFGNHVKQHFDRLNGRISLNDIRKDHVKRFGEKYCVKFEAKLEAAEKRSLNAGLGSIKGSYGNILSWRHTFVHGGSIASNASYEEARKSYDLGKAVLECLNASLQR